METDGVADIPLRGYGSTVRTNRFGQAVLTDVNSYYRNQVSVDLNTLPEEAQVAQSVKQGTLTEGAIGYRQFEVVSGHSAMALLRLADNSTPPFGAQVFNARGQQVGMVGDDGSTYLTGLNANDILQLRWDDSVQCEITLPSVLPDNDTLLSNWLLPCHSPGRQSSPVVKSAAVSTPLPSGKPAMRDDLTCTTSCQAEMKPVIEPANSQATRWLLK